MTTPSTSNPKVHHFFIQKAGADGVIRLEIVAIRNRLLSQLV